MCIYGYVPKTTPSDPSPPLVLLVGQLGCAEQRHKEFARVARERTRHIYGIGGWIFARSMLLPQLNPYASYAYDD